MARRGQNEDSIYFDRANNSWVGAVSLGQKAGKRVRRKVTGRTKTEVKAKLTADQVRATLTKFGFSGCVSSESPWSGCSGKSQSLAHGTKT